MKIVTPPPQPFDDDPRAWWNENRTALRQLRQVARDCGAQTYRDDMPPTHMERARIDFERRGFHPSATIVMSFGGGVDALTNDLVAALDQYGWLLMRSRPRGLVAEAMKLVLPVRLALAIRSWDPEALEIPETTAQLRSHHKKLRQMRRRIDLLERARTDADLKRVRFPEGTVEPSIEGKLVQIIEELKRQYETHRDWVQRRSDEAVQHEQVKAAIERSQPNDRLPPSIEREVSNARFRWWMPVQTTLRAAGWPDRELAALLFDDQWFMDLVPFTRCRYEGEAGNPALLEQIRNVRRYAARVSRKSVQATKDVVRNT